jgi:nucleoside-diphosphate-sugar epimerase
MHLITGSSGFVGSAIAKKLIAKGEKVRCIDIIEDSTVSKKCEFEILDISKFENLEKSLIFKDVKFVHHNAAKVPLTKAGDDYLNTNVIGTINVLKQCKKYNVQHLSHMSSSAIFGKPKHNQNVNYENYSPTGLYGKSKYLAELEVNKFFSSKYIKSCSVIRPRPIIGPGRLGIFQILFDWVKDDKKIPIIGDGKNLFQFSNIDDLVDVSIETATKNLSGQFNVGNLIFSTLAEDLNNSFNLVGSKSRVFPINKNFAKISLFILDKLNLSPLSSWHYLSYGWSFYYDQNSNFKRLEWRPKKSNIDLIVEAYNWYKKEEDSIKLNQSPHRAKIKQKALNIVKKFM